MIVDVVMDGLFAAVAAIGFASISNPPRRAYAYCAIIAAVGHSIRFVMQNILMFNIIPASTIAAFFVGLLAVWLAPKAKCPAETCFFPALLPMIPGMYAYRTIGALLMCMHHPEEEIFNHYLYLLTYNGFTCIFIMLGMVIGATLPIFMFKKLSFQATR